MKHIVPTTINPYVSVEVFSGTIGVVVQTERVQSYTLGGLSYGAPYTRCYAVFPGEPLKPLGRQKLSSHLQPTRALVVLLPDQKARIKIERPLGPIGVYVFEIRKGLLHVCPAWPIWSKKKLDMSHTGECDINSII